MKHQCTDDQVEDGCEWLHEGETQELSRHLFAPCETKHHRFCRQVTFDIDGINAICGCPCHATMEIKLSQDKGKTFTVSIVKKNKPKDVAEEEEPEEFSAPVSIKRRTK